MGYEFATNNFVEEWIPQNKRMLDMACGRGQLMDYATSKGCLVTGIDIIPQRKGVIKHDLNKKLPFRNGSFDLVTCIDSLEHVRNVSNVFLEARRVLADDGTFIFSVPNTRWYKNHNHVSYFTHRYAHMLIEHGGFYITGERHFIGIPRLNKYIVFTKLPQACFHFLFRLQKSHKNIVL